jgi:RNA polymerase sigma factor (sigma-70 family)
MNLHFSFKSAKTPDAEKEIQTHVHKLERYLHAFRPELVHLHGTLAAGRREGISANLNLRLPTGQLFAANEGDNDTAALKSAFTDLLNQLKRHKELLRSEHKWRRSKRTSIRVSDMEHIVKDALERATLHPPKHQNGKVHEEFTIHTFHEHNRNLFQADVRAYINANVAKLERFIDRELRFFESNGQLDSGQVRREEVLDEIVVSALSAEEKPASISVERWLYKLAIRAIQAVAKANGDDGAEVHLETRVGEQNVTGTDEAFLQYHQPGEVISRADVIPDEHFGNPEEIAANDEWIDQLEDALRGASAEQRETFILYAIEGFTVAEISQVTERTPERIKQAIAGARSLLMRKLPPSNVLKQKLIQVSSHVA